MIRKQKICNSLVTVKEEHKKEIDKLQERRRTLIENCRVACDRYDEGLMKQLKKINKKKLDGKVKLEIKFRQNKERVVNQLINIPGVGEKSLKGIIEYENFDLFSFTDDVRKGPEHLRIKYGLTKTISEKICNNLSAQQLREIEELQLEDIVDIYLLVGKKFKKLQELSKGQQCTAILNLLLIDNKDPLIIDQPEDNLDNSFIAENLVEILRTNKIKRQYLFATHNANIPVFGDAEQIITMEEQDSHGHIVDKGIGSIDDLDVK